MRVVMVKKRLTGGQACRKCAQTEELLRRRGHWHRIDEVVWAVEDDPTSPGMVLARRHEVAAAPFFLVVDGDGQEVVYESALKLIRNHFDAVSGSRDETVKREWASDSATTVVDGEATTSLELSEVVKRLESAAPQEIVGWALAQFGAGCAIAFSGADDVVLIDMAAATGLPFSVVTVDTGRLHPETYQFVEKVRDHYGIEIAITMPDKAAVEELVAAKGLFSFFSDGHQECCRLRKVDPLRAALSRRLAWMTGQRRDQSEVTRAELAVVEPDLVFSGASGPLVKVNPLARWTAADVWRYIRDRDVPINALHRQGYASIGCAPCTRPILPGQKERDGRWWWEDAEHKECGLHVLNGEPDRAGDQ